MTDWRQEIAIACVVRSAINDVDTKGLWEYHLPNVAASAEQIAECERTCGFRLDAEHHRFLLSANGWRCFYQSVDLFGTKELASPAWRGYLDDKLSMLAPVLADLGAGLGDFYPVAATRLDMDIFLLGKPDTAASGRVCWLAGQVIERYPSFTEFFLAMIDYNRQTFGELKGDAPPSR